MLEINNFFADYRFDPYSFSKSEYPAIKTMKHINIWLCARGAEKLYSIYFNLL